jgi:hypothetical protein
VRSTFPVLKKPANSKRGVGLSPEEFHYAFTNTLTDAESQAAYDRYAAPTSGRILFQGGLVNFTPDAATTYDFANNDRAPLLFISGGSDHILPPIVQRENYEKNIKHSAAITAHKVFADRVPAAPSNRPGGRTPSPLPSTTAPTWADEVCRTRSMRPASPSTRPVERCRDKSQPRSFGIKVVQNEGRRARACMGPQRPPVPTPADVPGESRHRGRHLLHCPPAVRVRGQLQDMHTAGAHFHHEEHADPAQGDRAVDMEEIAHQLRDGLSARELPPGRAAALRRGRDPQPLQDPPHRRGSDADPQPQQFAPDPLVASARVLPRHLLDQHHDPGSTGGIPSRRDRPTAIGPAASASSVASPASPAWTIRSGLGSGRAKAVSTARPAQSSLGLGCWRRNTATS